jgi:hypothetical protein
MENITGRKEAPVEVRDVRGESQAEDDRTCLECDHLIARGGWPHCNFYNKTTSLEVKNCSSFTKR